ncbi:hypothetical protein P389DRAFT_51166 [Cystobasidium minutum MCA 4210]|uniref:uncharacterized protein n=1 Tax=Cystobasidium minutum MCA 4210 TaxID=1397322 RepID=UPI0034CDC4C1|eukprot:jgi/Rhomi1/51166/CE51165_167
MSSSPKPLLKRPLDAIYFGFFLSHLVFSLALDTQALFPREYFPKLLTQSLDWFLSTTNDPLFRNGPQPWFRAFLWLELLFQCPVFIVGMIGLKRDDKRVWLLLAAYGAHAATTTSACLATVLADTHVTKDQRTMLLSSYVPYVVIPALLSIDMVLRLTASMSPASTKPKKA